MSLAHLPIALAEGGFNPLDVSGMGGFVWTLVIFGLALIPHAFAEWELRRDGEPSERATSASLAAVGWALLLVIACVAMPLTAFALSPAAAVQPLTIGLLAGGAGLAVAGADLQRVCQILEPICQLVHLKDGPLIKGKPT